MVARDKYKTRLCAQYQRGRCLFNSCKFAHGYAELRCSLNGHRGGVELRERLHRNRSPSRNSPVRRDGKARQTSHGDSSPGKRIDRNVRKRRRWDVHGNYSGRMSDGTLDQIEDRKRGSSEAKMRIDDQLREAYSEIMLLEDDKQQLQMYLEDKVKEADSLTFEIHELEMQLSEEKEEGKRFTTKIRNFIEAHNRNLRLQDQLKRSQAQLQNLGEHLDLDVGEGNEDDPNIKALSDDEGRLNSSSRRLRSRVEVRETSPQAGRTEISKNKVEKPHRSSRYHEHFGNSKRPEADVDAYNSGGPSTYEENPRKAPEGSNVPTDAGYADKYEVTEGGIILPSTDKAANAIDEDVEVAATDERFQVTVGPSNRADGSEDTLKTSLLPFPSSPPPIPQNMYTQYKGNDENVDIDGVDKETVEVDTV